MSIRRTAATLTVVAVLGLTGCKSDPGQASGPEPSLTNPVTVDSEGPAAGSTPSSVESGDMPPTSAEPAATETPSTSVDVGASQAPVEKPSASSTPSIAAPTAPLKQAADAQLPTELDGLKGTIAQSDDKTSVGQYTGASEDEMLIATLTKGQEKAAAMALLTEPETKGEVTCGTLSSTGLAGCYLWLEGGNVQLYGTNHTTVDQLRAHAESLASALG